MAAVTGTGLRACAGIFVTNCEGENLPLSLRSNTV
jgi:hypothetical protein